jgi:F0F1-type ATP synthase delta subunit
MKNDNSKINEIISDDIKAVEYLMSYYQKAKQSTQFLTEFLKSIGEDIKSINKVLKLSYNYG